MAIAKAGDKSQAVRLTEQERQGILSAVDEVSGRLGFHWKRISLFGSRVNSAAKGGDIDLYLEIEHSDRIELFSIKRQLRIALQDRLGEQKIDLLINDGVVDLGAFGTVVLGTKVDLWTNS